LICAFQRYLRLTVSEVVLFWTQMSLMGADFRGKHWWLNIKSVISAFPYSDDSQFSNLKSSNLQIFDSFAENKITTK